MKNQEVAARFEEIADALELKGEMKFKVLAYRAASRTIRTMTEDIADLAKANRLTDIPGIGPGTEKKIVEYLQTGRMKKHQEALEGLSPELLELLRIPGLGPRTLALAHDRLKVNDLADLKRVISDGSFAALPGMGEKKAGNLLQGIALREQVGGRLLLDRATEIAGSLLAWLRPLKQIRQLVPAGSLRRSRETVGDIDILVTGPESGAIIRRFLEFPDIRSTTGSGDTKASVVIGSGAHPVQVDLRVLPEESFGAALQYFTGSKEHNVKLRTIARQHGLKVSEYGVFRGTRRIAGRTEQDVYAALGMAVVPPELREDRGEVEAAMRGELPELVELVDIRGDLHAHTDLSDGHETALEMARAARQRGYEYLSISDHSVSAAYAGGLNVTRLRRSWDAIEKLNAGFKEFRLLRSAEVDILPAGGLDYPDRVLADADVVVASIHQAFRKDVTRRICDALANPHVDIIAHPSGRLITQREGYDVNLEAVLECARQNGKALECNAYPDRLDLNDVWLRKCRDLGVRVVVSTDAHAGVELDWMKYGVATARRGWLGKRNVLNTLSLSALLKTLSSGPGQR